MDKAVQKPEYVTCIAELGYSHALSYGRSYQVFAYDQQKIQYRVQGDHGRLRWFPHGCFAPGRLDLPTIQQIVLVDPLTEPQIQPVEVEVHLSNGESRLCWVVTGASINQMAEELEEGSPVKYLAGLPHVIYLSQLTEAILWQVLTYLQKQGQLASCTQLFREAPEPNTQPCHAPGFASAGRFNEG